MKLRYGIVSTATITRRFINAVKKSGDEVIGVASRTKSKAEILAKELNIQNVYDDYATMYADKNIDIVYIATNNATHVEQIKLALHYRKHVVCEKPIALNKQQAIEIFELARKQNCFLMEAQKSVFLPVTNDIKEIIEKQTLGKLHQVEMSSSFPNPTAPWMHDPTQGGVIYGSANYTFHYLDYLLNPTHSKLRSLGIFEESGTCERVSLSLILDNVLVNSRISMNGFTQNHAIFYFEHGYIRVPQYWKAQSYFIHKNETIKEVIYNIDFEMLYEVEHIHKCIENGLLESPIMSAKRSIMCCKLVDESIAQINTQ